MKTKAKGTTHVGLKRKQNEDNLVHIPESPNGQIFVVCDGMGGHIGGQIASRIAVESIYEFFTSKKYDNIVLALNSAILFANQQIYKETQKNPKLRGMGTTIVVLIIRNDKVFIAHVGDSRIYINSDNKLHRLTKDHSFVQQLVDKGYIDEAEAENHPRKNELLKALGTKNTVEATVCSEPVEPKSGDVFMLCSDGLCGLVNDMTMQQVLNNQSKDISEKAEELVQLALNSGGHDNITVQLVEVIESANVNSRFISQSGQGLTQTGDPLKTFDPTKTEDNLTNEDVTKPDNEDIYAGEPPKPFWKNKKILTILGAALLIIIVGLVMIPRLFSSQKYAIVVYQEGIPEDTLFQETTKSELDEYLTGLLGDKKLQSAEIRVWKVSKNNTFGKKDPIIERQNSGGKQYGMFILSKDEELRIEKYFDTPKEAKQYAGSYLNDYGRKEYYYEIWQCNANNEFRGKGKLIDKSEIDETAPHPRNKPSGNRRNEKQTINYTVKDNDSWISIYKQFKVCPCFIKKINQTKLDSNGNPRKGTELTIPLYRKIDEVKSGGINLVTGECRNINQDDCSLKSKQDNVSVTKPATRTKADIQKEIDETEAKINELAEQAEDIRNKEKKETNPEEKAKLEKERGEVDDQKLRLQKRVIELRNELENI